MIRGCYSGHFRGPSVCFQLLSANVITASVCLVLEVCCSLRVSSVSGRVKQIAERDWNHSSVSERSLLHAHSQCVGVSQKRTVFLERPVSSRKKERRRARTQERCDTVCLIPTSVFVAFVSQLVIGGNRQAHVALPPLNRSIGCRIYRSTTRTASLVNAGRIFLAFSKGVSCC